MGCGVCGCGAFYQSVYKAYVISLSILRVLCLFFLDVVVDIELMRFGGPYSLRPLYRHFHFVAIMAIKDIDN